MKILLVEDSEAIHLVVKAALGKRFSLTCVQSAENAIVALAENTYSLVILDVELPGEDGLKFCANLRADEKYRDIPIVILTGKSQTRDKVLAFSIGADDYVVKPIDLPEFQARIEAKMRRIQSNMEEKKHFAKGAFRVALAEQKIYFVTDEGTKDLLLSTIEFKLLYYFLRHEKHVLSRDQILNEVWGYNTHVTDRAVDTYVYSLRKKLGPAATFVQSIPRVGYKLSFSGKNRVA